MYKNFQKRVYKNRKIVYNFIVKCSIARIKEDDKMSDKQIDWEEFKTSVNRAAGKLAVKAEELEKKAKEGLHRKAVEARLAEEYEKLGRLAYRRLNSSDAEDQNEGGNVTRGIAGSMKNIEKLEAELAKYSCEDSERI